MSDPFNTTMAMPPQGVPAYGSPASSATPSAPSTDKIADRANEVKDVALERASDVTDKATDAAAAGKQAIGEVAHAASENAQQVVQEATRQARDLVGEAKSQVSQQVDDQHRKVITGLRSLSDELQSMTQASEQSGLATELVSQAQTRVRGVADWLDRREPGDLVGEARTFARRRPGTFLLGAALAGVVAGRMTRGVVAAHNDDSSPGTNGATPQSTAPQTTATAAPAPAASPAPPAPPAPQFGTAPGNPLYVPAPPDQQDTQIIGYSAPPAAPPTAGGYGGRVAP